jgi:beta-glucosidase
MTTPEFFDAAQTADRAAAIIEAFDPGMQGGRAIAELLTGVIGPSGRLPISLPRHAGQLPVNYNSVRGQHGESYADLTQEPLFAFGDGLSYTTVEYCDLRLEQTELSLDNEMRATITATNTGTRTALETVQVYIVDRVTSVTWTNSELKAFAQTTIPPGGRVDIELVIPVAACTRVVERGHFDLHVEPTSSEADLLSAGFVVS